MGLRIILESLVQRCLWPVNKITSTSPRKLLFLNNFLICIFSICLSCFSLYVSSLFYQADQMNVADSKNNSWVTWLGLAIVGLALTITCVIGMRGAHLVSLELLMTYFWAIVVFLAPLLLGTVASFDFYSFVRIYVRHRWTESPFEEPRRLFCPDGTADNKCKVPILGGPSFQTEDDWCINYYNSTDCASIRDTAMSDAIHWAERITLIQASVGIAIVVEIFMSVYLCYRILTASVIMHSMNDIINFLLLLPIGGCIGVGVYISWMRKDKIPFSWLCIFFIALGVAQIANIPLGVAAGRMKSQTMLSIYIGSVCLVTCGVVAAGVVCMIFSVILPNSFHPTVNDAATIACNRGLHGCCCCAEESQSCPEWSVQEIVNLTVMDIKIAGVVAFLSLLYLIGALVVAGVLRDSLKNYKCDFV